MIVSHILPFKETTDFELCHDRRCNAQGDLHLQTVPEGEEQRQGMGTYCTACAEEVGRVRGAVRSCLSTIKYGTCVTVITKPAVWEEGPSLIGIFLG